MKYPEKNLEDIQNSLSDAEEKLSKLSQNINTSKTEIKSDKDNVYIDFAKNTKNEANRNSEVSTLVPLLILILIIGGVIASNSSQSTKQATSTSRDLLNYSESCGTPPSQNISKRWWPVLGPADRSLLAEVRRNYCGDAYITANNSLQVASFNSWRAANDFKSKIEEVTNREFRVGQSTYIE